VSRTAEAQAPGTICTVAVRPTKIEGMEDEGFRGKAIVVFTAADFAFPYCLKVMHAVNATFGKPSADSLEERFSGCLLF
jgi:hypothetical protein